MSRARIPISDQHQRSINHVARFRIPVRAVSFDIAKHPLCFTNFKTTNIDIRPSTLLSYYVSAQKALFHTLLTDRPFSEVTNDRVTKILGEMFPI